MHVRWLMAAVILMAGLGCSRDQVYRGLYDGFTREPVSSDGQRSSDPPNKQPMTYDQYKYEREKAQDKSTDNAY